ncbi:MAG: arginine--tRNA ligase [Candidatus Aenigmatarchaeota archaeon]
MISLYSEISKLVGLEGLEETIEIPKPGFGDLASTICFDLAKRQKQSPQKMAEEIAAGTKIPENSIIERVEAKSGYLNFFLNPQKFAKAVLDEMEKQKQEYGKYRTKKKKILVEHTSINPNKAIHIGHARNSCLGDSIARILKFVGHGVQVLNYIDDSGTQVADIIVGFKSLGYPIKTEKKFDQYCGDDVYVSVNRVYEKNPELKGKRLEVIKSIEKGGNELSEFSEKIVDKVLSAQLETLWRLGIFFDVLTTETCILRSKLWEKSFEKLKKKNLVYLGAGKNAGCWMLKLSDLDEFKGMENPDKALVRSDGTVLYAGKDIAYAMWKHGLMKDFYYEKFVTQPNKKILWRTSNKKKAKPSQPFGNADMSINVVDVRQSYEQDVVATALKMISGEKNYTHYDYEVVSLSKKTAESLGVPIDSEIIHMSGRKGLFVNVDTVIEKISEKAYDETKKRNPTENDAWLRKTSGSIAASTLRYELTKIDRDKIIVFDIDDSLRLDGNTASYLQYAYARARRILEKSKGPPGKADFENVTDVEKQLLKSLFYFPIVVKKSAETLSPQEMCKYAYQICANFNKFYQFCPVLNAEKNARAFRLRLVARFADVLKNALELIGVQPIERM